MVVESTFVVERSNAAASAPEGPPAPQEPGKKPGQEEMVVESTFVVQRSNPKRNILLLVAMLVAMNHSSSNAIPYVAVKLGRNPRIV